MKKIWIRALSSFCYSTSCGLIVNLLIELIVQRITGDLTFSPLSSEFIAMFPSQTIAVEINALLYGCIGFSFSAAMFVYELERLGFIIQNIIYFLITSIVWLPILIFMWHLQRYPQALISTIVCFAVTYIIMSCIGYHTIKKDVSIINQALAEQENTTPED